LFTAGELMRRSGPGGLRWAMLTRHWTASVWAIVALKAAGGILVAATIKYADNIVKTFSTAVAILVTCFATRNANPRGASFLSGCSLVVGAVFMYTAGSKSLSTWRPSAATLPAAATVDTPHAQTKTSAGQTAGHVGAELQTAAETHLPRRGRWVPQCFLCGGGHKARDCPSRGSDFKCWNCGKTGHMYRECTRPRRK